MDTLDTGALETILEHPKPAESDMANIGQGGSLVFCSLGQATW